MGLAVIVQRGSGDKQGPDIVMDYFKSELTARDVGRIAIDQSTSGLKRVSGTIPGVRPFIRPGAIIRNVDLRQGEFMAKLEDFAGTVSVDADGKPEATISLTFRRKKRE